MPLINWDPFDDGGRSWDRVNAKQALRGARKRIEQLEDFNIRCTNDIKAYNKVIDEMIHGKAPCAWCMERGDCEDQTHGCENWVLDINHGEHEILSEDAANEEPEGDGITCQPEEEPRLLTKEEAELWCSSFDNELRKYPVYEETRRKTNGEWGYFPPERIDPYDDYLSADIVGYGEIVRLWTGMPTKEQREKAEWDEPCLEENDEG